MAGPTRNGRCREMVEPAPGPPAMEVPYLELTASRATCERGRLRFWVAAWTSVLAGVYPAPPAGAASMSTVDTSGQSKQQGHPSGVREVGWPCWFPAGEMIR